MFEVEEDLKRDGDVGVVGMERFSQAPRRWIGVVGVGIVGVGGVIGFDDRGPPVEMRDGGARVSLVVVRDSGLDVGGVGRGLLARGTEKAEPISDNVSERTCIRSEGAMRGTW